MKQQTLAERARDAASASVFFEVDQPAIIRNITLEADRGSYIGVFKDRRLKEAVWDILEKRDRRRDRARKRQKKE